MGVVLKTSGVIAEVIEWMAHPPLFGQGGGMRKRFADPKRAWSVGEVMRHGPMRYVPEFVVGEQVPPSARQRALFKQEKRDG